jgi:hypothetical protein
MQRLQLRRRFRTTYKTIPIPRRLDRPVSERAKPFIRRAGSPPKQARIRPAQRPLHEPGPQRVALDVPADDQKMPVVLHGKTLEPPLIHRPLAAGMAMGMPPLRVRDRHPADIIGQFAILRRPKDQMPVIGHETIAQQPRGKPLMGLGEDFLEGLVIASVIEDPLPADTPVEDMIDFPARGHSQSSGHVETLPNPPLSSRRTPDPLSASAPDKARVFREMFRVLKPGGRVAVSDIALKKPLPAELAKDLMAYVGCVAGAISIDDYRIGLLSAGFSHVHVVDAGSDLNTYAKVEGQSGCCSPPMKEKISLPIGEVSCSGPSCCGGMKETGTVHEGLTAVIERYNVNEYAASVKVYAVKR